MRLGTRKRPQRLCQMLGERPWELRGGTGGGEDWRRGRGSREAEDAQGEFPRETGLILRCAGKARNPFQTTQG